MSFLKKVNKTLNKAGQASSNLAATTKLKFEINEKQKAINEQYKQLGVMYYHQNVEHLSEIIEVIDSLNAEIQARRDQIEDLEPVKTVCTKCNAVLETGTKFCKLCGGVAHEVKAKEYQG